MTKSLSILLHNLFTQNSNIYKPLSNKFVLPTIRTHRKSFSSLIKLLRYGMYYQLLFTN